MLLLFTTQHLAAQSPYEGYPHQGTPIAESDHGAAWGTQAPTTGMDQMRQYPHPGPEWAATHGYPNYDHPDHHFGIWFRSQAWGLTKTERCAIPNPWRPRGFGNLFARPSTSHRMDYNRPYLIDPYSSYGPSYYVRQPDPRCCVRTVDGHLIYWNSRAEERALSEPCDD
jgi:hypothetical protein